MARPRQPFLGFRINEAYRAKLKLRAQSFLPRGEHVRYLFIAHVAVPTGPTVHLVVVVTDSDFVGFMTGYGRVDKLKKVIIRTPRRMLDPDADPVGKVDLGVGPAMRVSRTFLEEIRAQDADLAARPASAAGPADSSGSGPVGPSCLSKAENMERNPRLVAARGDLAILLDGLEDRLKASAKRHSGRTLGWLAPLMKRTRGIAWLVFLAFGFDVLMSLTWAALLTPFLLAAAGLWWLSARSETFVARTARDFSIPLLIGLTLLCLALFGLNMVLPSEVQPTEIRAVELWLSHARLRVDELTRLSLARLLVVTTVILIVVAVATNLDLVTRFKRAKARLSFVQIVLYVLTSFTVFAQVPLQQDLDRIHGGIVTEYRASLEREWAADDRAAAARAIRRGVQTMTQTQLGLLAQLLRSIGHRATVSHADRAYGIAVLDQNLFGAAFKQKDVRTVAHLSDGNGGFGPAPQAVSVAEENLVDPPPTTVDALDRQRTAANGRRAAATLAAGLATQALDLSVMTIAKLVGLALPIPLNALPRLPIRDETTRMVVEDLVDNLAERLEPKVERLFISRERDAVRRGKPVDEVRLSVASLASIEPAPQVTRELLVRRAWTTPAQVDARVTSTKLVPATVFAELALEKRGLTSIGPGFFGGRLARRTTVNRVDGANSLPEDRVNPLPLEEHLSLPRIGRL